jgi:hypothetical protein
MKVGVGMARAKQPEQLSAILAEENPPAHPLVDPGDMRTRMQQEAFPGEDISDRPLPDESIPASWNCLAETFQRAVSGSRDHTRRPGG